MVKVNSFNSVNSNCSFQSVICNRLIININNVSECDIVEICMEKKKSIISSIIDHLALT